jgi:diaminopimelate epimerase
MKFDKLLVLSLFLLLKVFEILAFSPQSLSAGVNRRWMKMAGTPFVKYQGLGNDFILVDNTKSSTPMYTPAEAAKLCDRNFGIGADGLIFAMPGQKGCDYTMRIYNSDGSEPQMCGNGIRCMARYLHDVIEGKGKGMEKVYKIWTNAGEIVPTIRTDGLITVDMGRPILQAKDVPTTLISGMGSEIAAINTGSPAGRAINSPLQALGKTYLATAVSMGNPHCVIFVESFATMDPPFNTIGPVVEAHPTFPQKVNAEFVEVISRSHVNMKVWERGAGPTLACGTGACATVVAGVLTGRTDRACKVTLPGGDLQILWDSASDKIFMTGPAEAVFSGSLN